MTIDDFIFSKKPRIKAIRHFTFWFLFSIGLFLNTIDVEKAGDLMSVKTYSNTLLKMVLFLPANILLVYSFTYFFVPKFILKKKYFFFAIGVCCAFALCFVLDFFLSRLFFHIAYPDMSDEDLRLWSIRLAYGIAVFFGMCAAGCATGIKLSKEWYMQQKENLVLAKEEASNKTRLLKSQIRPEFIFYSLENLQKKVDSFDENAAEMVIHLSEIYSYILYDCSEEIVPVEKEMTAIKNLIYVKELIEKNNSKINLQVKGNLQKKYIYPLSLFSVLEERIYSNDKEAIDLNINVVDEKLDFTLKFTRENIINAKFDLIPVLQQEEIFIPLNTAN